MGEPNYPIPLVDSTDIVNEETIRSSEEVTKQLA